MATTTLIGFIEANLKENVVIKETTDGTNLVAEVYRRWDGKRIANVYKSFTEDLKPCLIVRYPIEP